MSQEKSSMSGRLRELAAVVVSALGLILLFWSGQEAPRRSATPPRELSVRLLMENGECTFHGHAPLDRKDKSIDGRMLKVAQGTSVHLQVESLDYVYFLKQGELAIDLPVIPETVFEQTFTPLTPGRYDLVVSPVCGLPWNHAEPPGTIVVTEN